MDWGVSERSSTSQIKEFERLNSRSYLKSGRDKDGNLPRVKWGPNGYEPYTLPPEPCQPSFLIMTRTNQTQSKEPPKGSGKRYTPIFKHFQT